MNLLHSRIDERINRLLTQYRESTNLIHFIRVFLAAVQDVREHIETLPDHFNLDIAIGDQLTLIGKRLGFGRSHCVLNIQTVAGFDCEGYDSGYPIGGFCDDQVTWKDCGVFGKGEVTINDDEIYRLFLKVRVYQMKALFDLASLEACVKIFWGENATVLDSGHGRVVIAPGRPLTDTEKLIVQLFPRVLPVTLGIEIRFHFNEIPVAGFGEGWTGFCEPWKPEGLPIIVDGEVLVTEDNQPIMTGPLFSGGQWMCETNVFPYGRTQ